MVRETRYLWVGNLPEKVTEERVIEHFERYGKIQSVKLSNDGGERPGATVAFMDIKSASKAHNTDHELDGIHIPTKYSEPSGNSVTITRTLDPEVVPSTSRDGHRGYASSGLNNKTRFPNRADGISEERGNYERGEWYAGRGSGGEGSSSNFSENRSRSSTQTYENDDQYQDRGRSKQRFTAPQSVRSGFNQRQAHYEREGGSTPRSSQFDSNYSQEKHSEKRTRTKAWGSQSPARSDISNLSSRQRNVTYGSASHSGSRSRSSSSSSSSRSSSSSSRSGSRRKGTIKSEVASKNEIPSVSTQPSSGGESGEKRNLGISIRGLPIRSTDTSLRDGLYHEYKKHGKVTSVNIFGQNDDRYAIVSFKKPEDATKAIEASHEKMFFGTKIHVTSHEGFEVEDDFKTPEADLDEFHPKATRTLFVGNLEKEISIPTLKEIFKPFGEIIDIDIKKQGAVSAYAFVQYADITSVVRALRQMDGEHIGANKIKLGFGKSMPTNCVWLDNVADSLTEKCLCRQFSRYGPVSHSVIDKVKGRGLIYFDNMDFAQHAVNEMRARFLNGKKIHIDFASRDCQTAFFEKMERTGQLRPGERPDERAGRVHRSASGVYSVRYDAPVTIATTSTEIVKDVVKEKERYETTTRITTRPETTEQYAFTSRSGLPTRSFQTSTTSNSRTTFSGRSSRGLGNRQGFVDGNYTQEEFRERRQRHYDDYSADGGTYGEDTYEQELRDYGYRQQERRERGSLSPRDKRREVRAESPFSRSSRHQSPIHERHDRYEDRYSDRYSDRYRDTDSQSGDRESVRSYRSVRSEARRDFRQQSSFEDRYPERFVEEKRDHLRGGFSPTSSDYSHHSPSPGRYRSRSNSPTMSVGKERKVLNVKEQVVVRRVVAPSSLDDYSHGGQSSRNSSPMDYDMPTGKLKDIKSSKYASVVDSKSKERYTEERDIRERYGSEERTTISKLIGKPRPASYSETEKITAVSSKVKKPKFDSDEELSDIDRISEFKDRPSKKRYTEEIVLESSKDRPNEDSKRLDKRRSRSSSLGSSRTRIIPSENDSMEYHNDSVPKPKDLPAETVSRTNKTKGVKMDVPSWNPKSVEKPKKSEPYDPFENKSRGSCSGFSSDSSSSCSDEEGSPGEPDKSSLPPSVRLQKQQDYLLTLIQQLDDRVSNSDNDSHIGDDKNARKRIRIDGEEPTTKLSAHARQLLLKEIDQVKKNIEELEREQHRGKGLQIDSSKSYRKQMEQRRLEQQKQQPASVIASDSKPDHAPASPTHEKMEVDEELVESGPDLSPKEIPTEFKKKRKGEGGESESGKTRRYRPQHATDDLFNRINDEDEKASKPGDIKEVEKVVEKSDKPTDPRTAAYVESSEVTSRQSSIESQDPRSPPLEYKRDPKGILEIRTDSETKDSPIDRRSLHLVESHSKRDFPMSLPLPKFARQQQKEGKNSPKSHISTKTITPTTPAAVITAAGAQVKSPPFSPGGALASPLHSPALPKVDTPKDTSSLSNSLPSSDKDKELKPPPTKADPSKEKKTLSLLASPGSPIIKTDSDSEVSETEPGELSLEERIRALDEKLSLTAKPPSTPTTPSLLDYREKYKIRKRADSSASSLSSLPEKSEPSDIVKTVLARSSIFDQDSKRLEQIQEKYEPKVNVTLDDSRSLGVFRTKQTNSSAKELSLLSGSQQPSGNVLPLHQGLQSDSGQLSPSFLGASASAALAESVNNTPSAGEHLGNNALSPTGVATGAFSANFQSISKHGSSSPVVCVLPPPPAAGSQSTPPAPSSPPAPPASGASNHPTGASPKLSGLDAMPQLSVAVSTPSMSPGLIGRKGSLESATKSPLTPPVATTATSNVASMPSPSQTQPPQLDLSSPKISRKDSFGSSSLSSTSSVPSTPVSILKKQDSYEVFSPVTPILKKEMPPLTPILKEQPSPPMKEKKEHKDIQPLPSSTSTPNKRDSSSSSILGKRKASEEKTLTPKQDKSSYRSSSQGSVNKQDSGSSSRSGMSEPEAKKPKTSTKEKSSVSKSTSQKETKQKSNKHGSTSVTNKSPEKKHAKPETSDKKKQDEKHSKHSEKSSSKDKDLSKDEECAEKVKENPKEKVRESEKEPQRKEQKEEKELVKNKDTKHKTDKNREVKDTKDTKESKETSEKKTDSQREKKEKVRSKSGDKHHSTKVPSSSNSTDLKSKSTELKHKEKYKAEKTDKSDKVHKHDKSEKQDKDDKASSQEKLEKQNSSEKSKTDPLEKAAKPEPKEKSNRHEKKADKQDPRTKHREKGKETKDKKEDKNNKASSHDSKDTKSDKKGNCHGDKKKDKTKEKEQEREDRKDSERNKGKESDKSKKNSDSNKESESSSEKEKETKEERESREMRELLALQAKFDAEDRELGYGLSMYDVVKRRSSKEAEKEFENAARQRQLNAYQVSRRKKSRQTKSEDAGSSTQNSDDESATSSSTMEAVSVKKREKMEPKSKAKRTRVIESSSDEDDESNTHSFPRIVDHKQKELKKSTLPVKVESPVESDDEPIPTPKKAKKKEVEKREKPKIKKKTKPVSSESDSEDEVLTKHVTPPPPPAERSKDKKKGTKTKSENTEVQNKVVRTPKATPKSKDKKKKLSLSSDDDEMDIPLKSHKKESSVRKAVVLDISTADEDEMPMPMPKPKPKAKKEKVTAKNRILDYDSEEKEPEKPLPVTPKLHKEKAKEHKPISTVTATTIYENDKTELDSLIPTTPTPVKQKKSKEKHKSSAKKEKPEKSIEVDTPIKSEEINEIKPEKPHKKSRANKEESLDSHHHKSSHSNNKDGNHTKQVKTEPVTKEKDTTHSHNKESKVKKEPVDKENVEKEKNKDRSHQDTIASMMKEIKGDSYEVDPKMPILDDEMHPLDELLKKEARLEAEQKRDQVFNEISSSKKESTKASLDSQRKEESLGPPEIISKVNDAESTEGHVAPPKMKEDETVKKSSKKDGPKKGKKPKRKSKIHEDDSVSSSTNLISKEIKEEPADLPSLTKEDAVVEPPVTEEDKLKKEDKSDLRRSSGDNIFEKMERKEDPIVNMDAESNALDSLDEAPSLQPVSDTPIKPMKKDIKKDAGKLKETSQDELQRAVESILGADPSPPPQETPKLDFPEEEPAKVFPAPLEPEDSLALDPVPELTMAVDTIPKSEDELETQAEQAQQSEVNVPVSEQDEEEARKAAAALALLTGDEPPEEDEEQVTDITTNDQDMPSTEVQPPSSELQVPEEASTDKVADEVQEEAVLEETPPAPPAEPVVELTPVTPAPAPPPQAPVLGRFVPIPPAEPLVSEPKPMKLKEPVPEVKQEPVVVEVKPEPKPEPPVVVPPTPIVKPEPEKPKTKSPPKFASTFTPAPPIVPAHIEPPIHALPKPVLTPPEPPKPETVKETKKDPYAFDEEEEPEEGVPSMDILRHKTGHGHGHTGLLNKPLLDDTSSLSQTSDIHKNKVVDIGSPERRVFSDSDSCDNLARSGRKIRRVTKANRGRKKTEAEPRLNFDNKDDEPKPEAEREEHIPDPIFETTPEPKVEKLEEKPQRQSPRAKDKTTAAVLTAAPAAPLPPDEKPVLSKPEPEKPELKITIPLEPELRKTREGRKQEAPGVVSAPVEPTVEFSNLDAEPSVIEPPKHTEDPPIEDTSIPGENQEVLEEGLTDQESTTDTPREEGRPRRTKGKGKKAKEEEEEENDASSHTSHTSQKEVQRSPSARIRAKQEEHKKDAPEVKFSSRGRIIIPPKGRDGEVTPQGRKGRRGLGTQETPEPVRGRGRRGATSPASAMFEPEAGRGRSPRGRRTPKRFEKEDEQAEEEKREAGLKEEHEEDGSDAEETGRGGRRTPRRRKLIRRNMTGGSDKESVEKEDEESSKDEFHQEDNAVHRHNDSEVGEVIPNSPKLGRKTRRGKGRKSFEGPSMSPRRAEGPPGSPRGKALEQGSTSPKNIEYKPIVKLEKLPLNDLRSQESSRIPKEEPVRKDEEPRESEEEEISVSAHPAPRIGITFRGIGTRASLDAASKPKKDQYAFEDDDDKQPQEYLPSRRPKRKVSPRHYEEISMDSCMPESKRLKSEERSVEASEDGGKSADESAKSEHEEAGHKKGGEVEEKMYLDPKTGLLLTFPPSASPDTVLSDTKQDMPKQPLKVEMKHENEPSTEESKTAHNPPETHVSLPPKIRHNRKHDEAQRGVQQQPQQQPPQMPVKTEPTVPPLKITIPMSSITPSTTATVSASGWETNMDRIITAVARGELGTESEPGHVDSKQGKRKRRTSHVEEHPHPVPEPTKAPQPAPTVMAQSSKPSPNAAPPPTQGLHGAPQVAYPATPAQHHPASMVSISYNNKAVLTPPHTTMAPSVHQMPQQIPQKSPTAPMAIASAKSSSLQAQNLPPTSVIQPPLHQGAPALSSAQPAHPIRKLQQAGYPVREASLERERRDSSPATTSRPPVSVASNIQMDVVQQPFSISPHEVSPPGQVIEIVPNPTIMSPQPAASERGGELPLHHTSNVSQQQQQGPHPHTQNQPHSQQGKAHQQVPRVPTPQQQQQQIQQLQQPTSRASPGHPQAQVFPQTAQQQQPLGQPQGPRPQGHMPVHPQGQHMPGKPHPQGQSPHQHPQQPQQHQPRPALGKVSPAGTPSHVLHSHGVQPHSQKDQPGHPPHMQMSHYPAFSHAAMQNPATTTTAQSSIPQTSELRAALAMPSKLVQQEQMLQQRLQQQQLLRPMAPHTQEQQPSPGGTYGLHRMPFTLPEQRPGISRAEPKVPAERPPEVPASQAQFREQILKPGPPPSSQGSSAFSQPLPEQRVPLNHPERLLTYSGGPELRFPHPGVPGVVPFPGAPPGLGIGLPPRLGMDPRLMFPGAQPPHHEYPAHLMSPGLIPQHILAAHQQPGQIMNPDRPPSGRPLSRTTPPSAQPSPRPTPPPSREAPLVQSSIPSALSQHPSQALNTLMKGGPLQEDTHADDLYMILRRYPVMWQGVLALKNDSSNVQMHYLAGSQRLVRQALPAMTVEGLGQPLRIAQRMRLEQSQLEGVHRKMQNEEEYSMLLAIPCGRDHHDILAHTKALQAGFIQYLSAKQAAGIVNLAEPGSCSSQPAYVVHIFPPCEFSHQQMADLTPDLLQGIHEIAHLLIVIATVSSQ